MKLTLALNKDGFVDIWSSGNIICDNPISIDISLEEFQDFIQDTKAYYIKDGILRKSTDKLIEINNQNIIDNIRKRRREECFPVVNRGVLWYSFLTTVQKGELLKWYKDWLDATKTLIIPDKPEWIKEEEG